MPSSETMDKIMKTSLWHTVAFSEVQRLFKVCFVPLPSMTHWIVGEVQAMVIRYKLNADQPLAEAQSQI